MNLSITLAIYLGFLVESLWLWDAASERFPKAGGTRIKTPGLSVPATAASLALVTGALLIAISEIVGENSVTAALNNFLSYLLMGLAMFFLLIAGAVGGWLVPRVNEYNIVSVLAIVALNTLTQNDLNNPLLIGLLVGIPLVLSLSLVLQKSPPSTASKVILYTLYLGALIMLTLQNGILASFQKTDFTIVEAFIFGTMLCFLALHTLLGLRFLVITTAFVLPSNRKYADPIMRNLFKDEQLAPLFFFSTLIFMLAAVILNQRLALFPADTFAAVLVLVSTQLLFRPRIASEAI